MDAPKDFFISYNHHDRAWAEWIAWTLEAEGYTTIIQAWDFLPGSNFAIEMKIGLDRARRLLAVLSPHYLSSKFAQAEWAAAFAKDPTGAKRILLPVRVAPVDLGALDSTIVHIDLLAKTQDDCRAELLRGTQEVTRLKPSTEPAFPGLNRPSFPGSPTSSLKRVKRSMTAILVCGLLFVGGIAYYLIENQPGREPTAEIKSSLHETDNSNPLTIPKKPAASLTLTEEHR